MQSYKNQIGAALALGILAISVSAAHAADKAIKALVITGGCCHNYEFQAKALTEGISKSVKVEWTVVNEGGDGTKAQIPLYDNPDWAKGYDIVIHNECFADTTDEAYIKRITAAHQAGVPAMVIHCAMHTYRTVEFNDWREFLGVKSTYHEHQSHYPVKIIAQDHPIMKGFKTDWVTPMDELYVILKLWPTATALATSVSEKTGEAQPVVWVNQYGKARVFGTTYGHSDDTFADPVYIDLLTRGFKWAAKQGE